MGTLSLLPNETLLAIFSHICLPDADQADHNPSDGCFQGSRQQKPDQPSWYCADQLVALRSLCLVCKRFCHLAQPLLYRDFIVGHGDSWRFKTSSFSWVGRLERFIRTVAARPDLAAAVKHVRVHPDLLRAVTEGQARATLDEVVGAAATPEAASTMVADYLSHFDVFRRPPYRATSFQLAGSELLGLLLALLPNLDSLSMQVVPHHGGIPAGALATFPGIAARPGSGASPPLAHLRTLSICSHTAGRMMFSLNHHARGVLETLAATAAVDAGRLTTLNLHMCSKAGVRIAEGSLRHLKKLRITRSRFTAADLASLLGCCAAPGLEEFVYEATSPKPYEYSDESCQPSDAIKHLQKQHSTLKSLYLDFRYRGRGSSPETEGDLRPLSASDSMGRFTALENLFLNASAVCNGVLPLPDDDRLLTRLLPPNLTSLCLAERFCHITPRLGAALLHLASTVSRGEAYPALKRVQCDAALESYGLGELAVDEAFAAGGVEFGYDSWPRSEPTLQADKETPPQEGRLPLRLGRIPLSFLGREPPPAALRMTTIPRQEG